MSTPAQRHSFSNTPFPERMREYVYKPGMKIMQVTKNGAIRWRSYYWVYLTRGLVDKKVAAIEVGNRIWKVFYRNVFLGYFSENNLRNKETGTRLSNNLV